MNRNGLQAVLRTVTDACLKVPDAELLRRYVESRDEAAFADLVRRHGRLVWSVCRQLTGCDADADDAFQATFLVLVGGAGKVRDAGKLSAWLHGVAYKVCAKTRRSAKARAVRESATAKGQGGSVVADSAWDRALAAVHEEVARLPETLRVPFVLCCLEGKGASEAAEQLGWKLGTFSGRLTRAKDAVVARLDARGMTLAAVVAVAAPRDAPAAAVHKAAALCGRDFAVPGSILKLSQGVIGMSASRVKLLAVGLFAVCGLGVGGRAGWLATADAQSAPPKPAAVSQQDKIKQLEQELERLKKEAAEKTFKLAPLALPAEKFTPPTPPVPPTPLKAVPAVPPNPGATPLKPVFGLAVEAGDKAKASDYDFVLASEMGKDKFVALLRDREAKGWEYKGEATLTSDGKAAPHWVFRKAAKTVAGVHLGDLSRPAVVQGFEWSPNDKARAADVARVAEDARGKAVKQMAEATKALSAARDLFDQKKASEQQAIEIEIEIENAKLLKLTKQLAEAKAAKPANATVTIPLTNAAAADVVGSLNLVKLAGAKFSGSNLTVAFDAKTNSVLLSGTPDVMKWAAEVIKSIDGK